MLYIFIYLFFSLYFFFLQIDLFLPYLTYLSIFFFRRPAMPVSRSRIHAKEKTEENSTTTTPATAPTSAPATTTTPTTSASPLGSKPPAPAR